MDNNAVEKIRKALLKRAVGYSTLETVVEYSGAGEDETVVRKKVTKKEVPPDISAAKLLLEERQTDGYSTMTDEQLEAEKRRLLLLLKGESENGGESKSTIEVLADSPSEKACGEESAKPNARTEKAKRVRRKNAKSENC